MNKAVKNLNVKLNNLIPGGKINHNLLEMFEEHRQAIDNLKREKENQINSAEKIYDLIRMVERRKNEIIMRTYKQVNVNFKEIFQQFVPRGEAFLQFITRHTESNMQENMSSTMETSSSTITSNGSTDISIRSEISTEQSLSSSFNSTSLESSRGILFTQSLFNLFDLFFPFLFFERTIHRQCGFFHRYRNFSIIRGKCRTET